MQPRLALLVIATMPVLALQALSFGRRYRPLSLQIQKQLKEAKAKDQSSADSAFAKKMQQSQGETTVVCSSSHSALARSARRLLALGRVGGLVLTGGDTALAVCAALAARRFEVILR